VGRLLSTAAATGEKDVFNSGETGREWELQGKVWTGWGSECKS